MVLEKNARDGILMRVVIVEDNNEDAKHLTDCLNKFSESHGVEFQIMRFDTIYCAVSSRCISGTAL